MDQTRLFGSNNFQLDKRINRSSLDESWEEQAFAEDAANALGWPPRSYSCSFCGREFRSAQALGGHMNVHRREKARSKQVHGDQSEILGNNEKFHQYPAIDRFTSMAFHCPSQVCTMVHNPNPKSDLSGTILSTSPSWRISTPSTVNSTISWSQFKKVISTDRIHDEHGDNQRIFDQEEKSGQRTVEDGENYIKADLSVSLNLVIRHSSMEAKSCKRKRVDESLSKRIFQDKLHVQSEVNGLASTAIDGLDLELRLGGRPSMN